MNKALLIVTLGGLLGAGAFIADARNQAALQLMLKNAAAEKPLMQGVFLKVPFLKDPAPKKAYPGLYPEHFTWGTDATLKYTDLGEGYWQTNGINLADGHEVKAEEDEWKAHLRFKSNPTSDPIHPGHSVLAIDSRQHTLAFAPLGPVDYDQVLQIPENQWLKRSTNEQAAVWNLKPGDVIGVRIDAVPLSSEPGSGGGKPRRHRFIAKLLIQKLSHESVRFDYVYRNDGKQEFLPPSHPEDQ